MCSDPDQIIECADGQWLAGGALVGAVVPFTFAFTMSTNRLLLDAASPPKDDQAYVLLAKWARLHVRAHVP